VTSGRFLDHPDAAPTTRRNAALWIIIALFGFVVGQIVALLAGEVAAALAGQSGQLVAISKLAVPPEWYVVSTLFGLWVGFLAAPWFASRIRGTGNLVRDLGIRFRPIDVIGILIGIGGQVIVAILYAPFIKHLKNFNGPTTKLTGGAHGGGFLVIAIFTVFGAPFFEELFFRGLIFKGLLRFLAPKRLGPSAARTIAIIGAVALDGLLFGLAHGEFEQLAGLAVFGAILAVVAYRTSRLGMNMVAHSAFNAVAVVSIYVSRGGVIH
jgi:membrane protease YdiL (CAAX protease family)